MRIIIPIVTVWHHFFLLTNGKSRAVQTRGQKLYRSAKPLFSLIVQTSPHLILDLSRDGQWKGKKSFPKKKVFLFLYPLERRCKRGQTKKFFVPMPRKLELMFNILFTPLLNYTLQKCQSTLKWIFPPLSYLSIFFLRHRSKQVRLPWLTLTQCARSWKPTLNTSVFWSFDHNKFRALRYCFKKLKEKTKKNKTKRKISLTYFPRRSGKLYQR